MLRIQQHYPKEFTEKICMLVCFHINVASTAYLQIQKKNMKRIKEIMANMLMDRVEVRKHEKIEKRWN